MHQWFWKFKLYLPWKLQRLVNIVENPFNLEVNYFVASSSANSSWAKRVLAVLSLCNSLRTFFKFIHSYWRYAGNIFEYSLEICSSTIWQRIRFWQAKKDTVAFVCKINSKSWPVSKIPAPWDLLLHLGLHLHSKFYKPLLHCQK